jgi:2-methylcitrate dehydratase PrpD
MPMNEDDRVTGKYPESPRNLISRSNRLAQFVSAFDPAALPAAVRLETKRLIVDTLAAAYAGCRHETSRIHGEVVAFLGGNPQASVVGQTQKVSIPQAGQINARMANALDLDDCYMNVAHFAPQTVFGALAAGEFGQISGPRLLSAVALGYDVAARICLFFMFWRVRRGLIATRGSRQVYGANAFAAMAASAHALGLTREQTRNAFGNCGHFAPCLTRSIMPVAPSDEMNKYCDAGWSTHAGIMATLMARGGYLSSHYTLDGRDGYADVMGIDYTDDAQLTRRLGARWHILDAALKTHPCCKYVITPLQIFMELCQRHRLRPSDIRRVDVQVRPSHAVGFAVQVLPERSRMPFTHNIPFNFAQAVLGRSPGAQWHDAAALREPRVKAFMKKVFVHPLGEALTVGVEDIRRYGFPREIPARVEIAARQGRFAGEACRAKGDPWWPETRLSDRELLDKLLQGCEGTLPRGEAERLFDAVMHLEKQRDVSVIGGLLHGADRARRAAAPTA